MTFDLEGKLIADKYRIESLISESDSGDLYHAVHELRGFPVTLEVLPAALAMDKRWATKFLERARAAAALDDPNILAPNDLGEDSKGVVYAAYDAIDGVSLREIIETQAPLDQIRALSLARSVGGSLTAAHAKGLIHGRLDPNSIFVSATDSVKVIGFGGDKLNVPRDADPRYLAPEQTTEYPVADGRSDIFALGALLFQMLSNEVPWNGATRAEIVAARELPPAPLSSLRDDLHKQIEPVIMTALAHDPDLRYQNVTAFAEDLERISTELGGPKTAAAAAGTNRNIWKTATIALFGIVVLAGALIYATSVRSTDPTGTLAADADALPVQPINPATGAQEEALLRNGPIGDPNGLQDPYLVNGQLPGGDGYNPWATGAIPSAGAPLPDSGLTTGPLAGSQMPANMSQLPPQAIAPPGQTVQVPTGDGRFTSGQDEGGLILVYTKNGDDPNAKPAVGDKNTPPGNSAVKPPASAPAKPLATPPVKPADKPADTPKTVPAKPVTAPVKKKTDED